MCTGAKNFTHQIHAKHMSQKIQAKKWGGRRGEERERRERRERGGGGVKNSQARACTMGAPKKKGLENLEVRSGHKIFLSRDDEKWNEKNCLGRDLEGWKKVEYHTARPFYFASKLARHLYPFAAPVLAGTTIPTWQHRFPSAQRS